jgi:hypothetical protein
MRLLRDVTQSERMLDELVAAPSPEELAELDDAERRVANMRAEILALADLLSQI